MEEENKNLEQNQNFEKDYNPVPHEELHTSNNKKFVKISGVVILLIILGFIFYPKISGGVMCGPLCPPTGLSTYEKSCLGIKIRDNVTDGYSDLCFGIVYGDKLCYGREHFSDSQTNKVLSCDYPVYNQEIHLKEKIKKIEDAKEVFKYTHAFKYTNEEIPGTNLMKFESSDLNFSFEYLSDWNIEFRPSGIRISNFVDDTEGGVPRFPDENSSVIVIYSQKGVLPITSPQDNFLGGLIASRTVVETGEQQDYGPTPRILSNITVNTNYNGYYYSVSLKPFDSQHKDIFEKILSTFKFLDVDKVYIKDDNAYYYNSIENSTILVVESIKYDIEDSKFYENKTYKKATLSPNGEFILLEGTGFEWFITEIYDISSKTAYTVNENGYIIWLNDNRIKVEGGCGMGTPCGIFESINSEEPWILEKISD